MGKSKSKSKPPPSLDVFGGRLRMDTDAIKGRKLTAVADYEIGELLIAERPSAIVLFSEEPVLGPTPCSRARLQEIADQSHASFDLLCMVVKVYLWLEGEKESVSETGLYRKEGTWLCATVQGLAALEAHLDKQPTDWVGSLTAASHELSLLLPGPPTPASLLLLAAKVNVNSYGILSPEGSSLGFCMLPAVGLLINHSCDPNCHYVFDSDVGTMNFRALRRIAPGEEITVSYIDTVQSTSKRGAALLATKHFVCICPRCEAHQVAVHRAAEGHPLALDLELELDLDLDSTPNRGQKNKNKKTPAASPSAGSPRISSALLLADAYLDGLHCHTCGSSGVVLENGCLLCCTKAASCDEIVQAKSKAEVTGADIIRAVKTTPTVASRVALEQWLSQYDPGFSPLSESFKSRPAAAPVTSNKKRRPLQLHPCHALVLEALTALASLLLHQADVRGGTACIRRSLRILSPLLPACHPEILALQMHLADALGPGNREGDDLRARCAAGHSLLYGATAPTAREASSDL